MIHQLGLQHNTLASIRRLRCHTPGSRASRLIGLIGVLLLVTTCRVYGQSGRVRGFVRNATDGQPLPGVNVAVISPDSTVFGSSTDRDGFFLVGPLSPASYTLQASFIGFDTHREEIPIEADRILTLAIQLQPSEEMLDEVVIEADASIDPAKTATGMQAIRPSDLRTVPTLDLSSDLASYLSTVPGIVTTGDRGGQLFIRGGEPSQNLALLDGMPIFQPFHILGSYSIFSSDLLHSADLYTGGFSPKYAGRISSVLDVQTRFGNKQAFRRSLSLSPFVNHAILEGPLVRGKASFLGSARQSVIDRGASKYVDAPMPFAFGDLFGKVHADLSSHHQLSFTALHTYDRGALTDVVRAAPADSIRWHNTAVGARYLILPAQEPILGEVLVSWSRLRNRLGPNLAPERDATIQSYNTAVNLVNYTSFSEIAWGFFLKFIALDANLGGTYQNVNIDQSRSTNAGAYIQPTFRMSNTLRLEPGLLVQYFGSSGVSFEPRFRLSWTLAAHQLSAAAGLYRQEIIGLHDRRDLTNVFTAWTETPHGNREESRQLLLGYRFSPHPAFDATIEGFATRFLNLSTAEWTAFPRFTTNLQAADGKSIGFDAKVRASGRFGQLGFSYGYTWVRYHSIEEDLTFRPPHDRRHQVDALAQVTLFTIDFNARWQFGSGLPYTQVRAFDRFIFMNGPVDVSRDPGTTRVIYDAPFGGELPAYHRLDISATRRFTYGEDSYISLQAGVMNAYNRDNLLALDLFTLQRIDQLPLMPTLGIKFEF